MKKNIFSYNQLKLLNSGLDMDELVILDYIAYFKNSGLMEEHIKDGKSWNWISWAKIEEDLPFLKMKKESIQRKCLYYLGIRPGDWDERVSKMTENTKKKVSTYKFLGMIEFSTVGKKGEEKTIFRFTEKWYRLVRNDGETPHTKPNKDNKKGSSAPTEKPNNKNNNKFFDTNSIPHDKESIQEENNNFQFITDSGIKNIDKATKKQKEDIKKWDFKLLEECVNYMYFNCEEKFNLSYLIKVYNNPIFKNKETKATEAPSQTAGKVVTRFHNINQSFTKYGADELEKRLKESQEGKFK